MIVKTQPKRKEKLFDTRNKRTIDGIACPHCGCTKRLTGKTVAGTERRMVFCGLCGACFYEDEGVKNG